MMLGLRRYRGVQVDLYLGDLTEFCCDAMVTAANAQLAGGGGVDGAIHSVGGPGILAECKGLGGCETGNAKVTTAGNLPAKILIHAVGPIWRGGSQGEPALLRAAHAKSLAAAEMHQCRHIAFPAISTGVYNYPVDLAATEAMTAVKAAIDASLTHVQRVTFVLFSMQIYETFQAAMMKELGTYD